MKPRRLLPADLEAVADIETQVQMSPWTRTQILAIGDLLTDNYLAWVTENDSQRIVAYLIAQKLPDALEILSIGVVQNERSRGVGFALWQYAWRDVRTTYFDITSCFLEVRERNMAAQSLYARCGFLIVGRRRAYYQNPTEDALILHKQDDDIINIS